MLTNRQNLSLQTSPVFGSTKIHVQSWYLVCSASKITSELISTPFLDKRLLLFRDSSGKVRAYNAYCPHMGADLGLGKRTVDGHIQCLFHHWKYSEDGKNLSCRGDNLFSFPAEERFGFVFVFNGPTPIFSLPEEPSRKDYIRLRFPSSWLDAHPHIVTANGLDVSHFGSLHEMPVTGKPHFEENSYGMTVSFEAQQKRKWLRLLLGLKESAKVSFCALGGNLAWVTFFEPYRGFLLLANRPCQTRGGCETHAILYCKRGEWLKLFQLILLNILFSKDDTKVLSTMKFNIEGCKPEEAMSRFYQLVNRLPTF